MVKSIISGITFLASNPSCTTYSYVTLGKSLNLFKAVSSAIKCV